ncbi:MULTISPECIES: recombinase family protein [Paenibacillus]|uniref:recombinase family protein n=1 Tax=Paenibacillus TaxID=44249 RepID=UPI0009E38B3F|nr:MULTISPECIES: recombinase family protein [Paenibacillus]WFA83414.1 recombinase family protein [Paenibacillus amylolyticus]
MRCAIYVRVSTDKEEQKTSLENQKNLFLKYVSERGWTVFDFYVEIESGTTSKRPVLQRLITDAKAKKFDMILAKELSRLARNGGLSYEIRDVILNHNLDIITLDNAINTPEGNVHMFGLYAWMYEQESQRISDRVKTTFKLKAQRGEFKGSIPPLGYGLKDGRLYVRNDPTPDIVRRIYRGYLAGKGHDCIARELYEEGIPTPSQIAGKKNASEMWGGSTVRGILTNPHYVGDLVQCRSTTKSVTNKNRNYKDPKDFIIVQDTHEPIVTRKDFEVVQQLLESRKRTRPQSEAHLFTNTAYCADCGRGMHFKKNVKGYLCGSYNKYGSKKCTDHLVRETELISVILHDIQMLVSNLSNDAVIKKLENQLRKQKQQNEKVLRTLDTQMEKLRNRKKQAHDKHFDGDMPKREYDEYVTSINLEIDELMQKKCQYDESLQIQDDTLAFSELKKTLEEFLSFKELTPEILHRLIDRIEIKADGSPRIFYRFSNPSAYSLLLTINAQHSTCTVCGNISTGVTSTVR